MDIKELIQYLFNKLKVWIIVKEWEDGIHLRFGKIRRTVDTGIYIKLPMIDSYYLQPNRSQEIHASHINALTKDLNNIAISGSVTYVMDNVKEFYIGYAEPNEIVSAITRNAIVNNVALIDSKSVDVNDLQTSIENDIKKHAGKGFKFECFRIVTITNARTYRLIKDNLYSQDSNGLNEEAI